jgi:hypothetical protein
LLSLFATVSLIFVIGLPGRRRRVRAALGLGFIAVLCLALGCGGGGTSAVSGGGSGGGSTSGGSGTGSGGGTAGDQPQQTSITLTTSLAKLRGSSPILPVITATITASKPLTGTVSFYNFGNPINAYTPLAGNQAQLANSSLFSNVGFYQITATYSGDSNNLTSTSAPLTEVVTGIVPVNLNASTGEDLHVAQAWVGVQ